MCLEFSSKDELVKHVFARQALPMTWDFGESNPWTQAGGSWNKVLDWLSKAIPNGLVSIPASVSQVDAMKWIYTYLL
jgi:putative DNA methylase